jgi:uncharacterized protein (DUF1697 family)
MTTYLILFRGLNVGGKNKIAMKALKQFLEDQGFGNVTTYIQSGNAILQSKLAARTVAGKIEKALPAAFKLDTAIIKVRVLSLADFEAVIKKRPKGFGSEPTKYHSDAIFLMDLEAREAMPAFSPKEGVDTVWPGDGVIYSQRLSALRTKSRLGKAMSSPLYKSMTIRSWSTTMKLLDLLREADAGPAN